MRVGIVFPGQGSQYNKMGLDFLNVSEESVTFCGAVEKHISIGINELLSDVEKNDELSQLRIVVAEILIYLAFKSEILKSELKNNIEIDFAAGHSLGEFSALYVSGILTLSELLNLVLFRNKIIKERQFSEKTTMIAITNSDISSVIQLILDLKIKNLFPSNINSYKQIVYSGTVSAISELKNKLDDEARGVVLNVNQGYHSPLMENASEKLKNYLLENNFKLSSLKDKEIRVLNNLTGNFYSSKKEVLANLPEQLVSAVNWIKVIEKMSKSVDCIIEIGPGKALTKFNKNILKKNNIDNIYLGHIENARTLDSEVRKIYYEINKFKR